MRLVEKLRELLSRPHAVRWIIILATVLVLPALATGRVLDDHAHHMMLQQEPLLERGPHELYSFLLADPEVRAAVLEKGAVPWYADPEVKATFLRPVASLLIYLDYLIAPDAHWVGHVHSVLWYVALLLVMAAIYRRLVVPAWVAVLALALFALDDAHGVPVGWVANRHAVVAMTFGALALLAHVRWRQEGCRLSAVLGPLALAVGLLSSGVALCVAAYGLAFAWFLDRASVRARVLSLVPTAAVCGGWRVVYRAMGHGIRNSGIYNDPASDPLGFLAVAAERFPTLLLAQLTPISSDAFVAYPPLVAAIAGALAAALVLLMLVVVWRFVRQDRSAQFWTTGLALSALPLCAVFPHDRMLLPVGIGGAGLVALFLSRIVAPRAAGHAPSDPSEVVVPEASRGAQAEVNGVMDSEAPDRAYWQRRSVRVLAWVFIGTHVVLAPLLLPLRTYSVRFMGAPFEAAALSLDEAEPLAGKTLVFMSGPDFFTTAWAPLIRRSMGLSTPDRIRTLATTRGEVGVTREDARTLRVSAQGGMLTEPLDHVLRSPQRPLRGGERVVLSDWEVEVTRVTDDGRPAEIRTRFALPLEDTSMVWVAWTKNGYRRFTPPAVGGTARVAGSTPMEILTVRYRPDGSGR